MYFRLYPNFIPVWGKKRCIIADIQKGEYFEIPFMLFEVLNINKDNNLTVNQLDEYFKKELTSGINGFFNLFKEKKFGFFSSKIDYISPLIIEYKSPYIFSNAIIEIDSLKYFCLNSLISSLLSFNCQNIEIRILNQCIIPKVVKILKNFQDSNVRNFHLIFTSGINKKINVISDLRKNRKITDIMVFNSVTNKLQKEFDENMMFYIKDDFVEKINSTSFIINPKYFYESHRYNASLNQKIAIDKRGNIKNYLSHEKTFGNINNRTFEEILSDKEFLKIWHIPNDLVENCKECELRYFCLNFSEIKEENGLFIKVNYCDKHK